MGGGWEREDTEGGYEREQWCVTGVGTMDESGKLSWHYCYCYYLWTRDGSDICKLYHTNKQRKTHTFHNLTTSSDPSTKLSLVLENEWLYSFCLKCFPMTNDPLLANNTHRAGNSDNNNKHHGNSSPSSFVLRYHV